MLHLVAQATRLENTLMAGKFGKSNVFARYQNATVIILVQRNFGYPRAYYNYSKPGRVYF